MAREFLSTRGGAWQRAGWIVAITVLLAVSWLAPPRLRAADTLPNEIADEAFWQLIETTSETSGAFQSENFMSNETGYQAVIPLLTRSTAPNGVYLGVGPEQNFTYIAALHPKIAFIIDIRRQNMLEHLIYKALFEMSADRAEFVSRLFSLTRPAGLSEQSTVDELFRAYSTMQVDNDAFRTNLQDIKDRLLKTHQFGLTSRDEIGIEHVFTVFRDFGPLINYNSGAGFAGRRGGGMPDYIELMTAMDRQGEQRSYLASEENYRVIRDLERRNLIVPVAGDFGGKKALRAVGQYLKDHDAVVTAFYLSNVERYLFQGNGNQNGGWTTFYDNVATLPLDASSVFIRSGGERVPGRRFRHARAKRPGGHAGDACRGQGRPHPDVQRRLFHRQTLARASDGTRLVSHAATCCSGRDGPLRRPPSRAPRARPRVSAAPPWRPVRPPPIFRPAR